MSSLMNSALAPILGAATDTVKEGTSLLKHRRENPLPLPSKALSANVTVFGLVNNVQPQTDNRDESQSGEKGTNVLENLVNGAAIGVGIGVGLAGVMWLLNKTTTQAEPSQRPLSFATPAFQSGRVLGEETEGGEERVLSLEEEEEFVTLV
jgi:hypothetical protein